MNCFQWPLVLLLMPLAFACFALAPQARATCQDACLTNDNTVQGDDALISLTTGTDNTAIGYHALYDITTSSNYSSPPAKYVCSRTRRRGGTGRRAGLKIQ